MHPSWRDFLRERPADRHIALFYRDDAFLSRAVAWWSSAAITAGGSAVLVGRVEKLRPIRRELARLGVDLEERESQGRLVLLDARETLDRFVVGGMPERTRFRAMLDEAVSGARKAAPTGEVRAWGEMVDLLWAQGQTEACCHLESLWGEVLDSRDLHLLCSYAVETDPRAQGLALRAQGHRRVLVEADADGLHRQVAGLLVDVFGEPAMPVPDSLLVARQAVTVGGPDHEAILLPLLK